MTTDVQIFLLGWGGGGGECGGGGGGGGGGGEAGRGFTAGQRWGRWEGGGGQKLKWDIAWTLPGKNDCVEQSVLGDKFVNSAGMKMFGQADRQRDLAG